MRILVLLAFVCAVPAAAQDSPSGSLIKNRAAVVGEAPPGANPQLRARQVTDDFAKCLVVSRQRAVDRLLTIPAVGTAQGDWAKGFDIDSCLAPAGYGVVKLRMPFPVLRGAVFRALYVRDRRGQPLGNLSATGGSPPPLPDWSADIASVANVDPAETQSYIGLRNFAACVVLAKPLEVHDLLLAKTGFAPENAALALVTPAIAGCLPTGETLRINKQVMIGLLAETAYRLGGQPTP